MLLYLIVNAPRAFFVQIIYGFETLFSCSITACPPGHSRIHIFHTKIRRTNIDRVFHRFHHGSIFLIAFPKSILGLFAQGDVIHIAFVADNLALWIINSPGAVGYPDLRTVFAPDSELEMFHRSILFEKLHKKAPIFRVYVVLLCNIENAGNEFFRRCITEHPGKSRVDTDKTAFRCALKKTFDGIFKNAPIFFFALN